MVPDLDPQASSPSASKESRCPTIACQIIGRFGHPPGSPSLDSSWAIFSQVRRPVQTPSIRLAESLVNRRVTQSIETGSNVEHQGLAITGNGPGLDDQLQRTHESS